MASAAGVGATCALMLPVASRCTHPHSWMPPVSCGVQRLSSWRSFFPARAGGAATRLDNATARTRALAKRERPLGKDIGEYGKVAALNSVKNAVWSVGRSSRDAIDVATVELTTGDPSLSLRRSMVAPMPGSTPRWILRVVLLAAALAAAAGALLLPAWQRSLTGASIGVFLAFGMAELFWPGLERFVGQRYLHSSRRPRRALVNLVVALALTAAGLALFFLARKHQARGWETVGVIATLAGGFDAVLSVLLLQLSVFSTVSAMGVVLGVASLIVVLAVTSGFEREFQDKVLGAERAPDRDSLRQRGHRLAGGRPHRGQAARHARRGAHGQVPVLGRRGHGGQGRRQPERHRPRAGGRRSQGRAHRGQHRRSREARDVPGPGARRAGRAHHPGQPSSPTGFTRTSASACRSWFRSA